MPTLYWTCAILIIVAQVMILRSTFRAQRAQRAQRVPGDEVPDATEARTAPRNGPLEWAFAVVPALALVALLVATWRAVP